MCPASEELGCVVERVSKCVEGEREREGRGEGLAVVSSEKRSLHSTRLSFHEDGDAGSRRPSCPQRALHKRSTSQHILNSLQFINAAKVQAYSGMLAGARYGSGNT